MAAQQAAINQMVSGAMQTMEATVDKVSVDYGSFYLFSRIEYFVYYNLETGIFLYFA